MKGYVTRPGQGMLFANRNKKNEKHPDYKGTAVVSMGDELIEVEIAIWERRSEKAGRFYSLSVKATNVRPNEDINEAFKDQRVQE